MKKVVNRVEDVVDEALDGMALAFPAYVRRIPNTNVLARAVPKKGGRVGLVSGGGSGHEPAHGGYVGYGMLDAAVAGEVFTSPTPDQVLEGIRAANHGAGVLLIVKNYTGDVMNFDIARELAEAEGIEVASVTVDDDVAVQDSLYTTGRRGIAGTIYVHKIAGALAERGASLAEVKAVAESVISRVRSMGFALTPCTVPANGTPTFTLEENELEMGIGIHGEPGIQRESVRQADELAESMLDRLSSDLDLNSPARLAAMINGMGGTPMLELAILARKVAHWSQDKGHDLRRIWMGEYMTSLEMQGASLTLLSLDDRLQELLDAPSDTPALRQGVAHD
ncbi:dihydroxyacetone kinase subunit DhaK [Sulfobacillus harzensis]|uniref:Dihydroxyacetone kinase subunit DhaK n=1 Tax=Sulfobacillus harzensis TaxID=2729629 RepID=A0A7Y0L2U3_9FIRM|nr:dihydroxyacetone kinase subunit DhaK [Sulfobacillus harzensis]NMP22257.1 dihydroxyacetone kinase subunit DhaK [Sulfobacillus harzensis]